jgi:hypothetical protein
MFSIWEEVPCPRLPFCFEIDVGQFKSHEKFGIVFLKAHPPRKNAGQAILNPPPKPAWGEGLGLGCGMSVVFSRLQPEYKPISFSRW